MNLPMEVLGGMAFKFVGWVVMSGVRLYFCLIASFATTMLGAAPPQITQLSPTALAPGKTTDVALHGQNLAAARQLWTTFASRTEFLPAEDEAARKGEKLTCRVTVPRDAQVGIGALRLVTGEGVSNPMLPMLDDLPTVNESQENHTAAQAQPLGYPVAIDGQCDALLEDIFRFQAAAGQRLSFEVVAQRMGSKLDAIARILSADGRQEVQLDDAEGSGGDARFTHTFATAGDYLLSLGDVRHAGGSEYRYRLRVGSFPLITSVYPAGGQSGAVASFELLSAMSEPSAPLHVLMPNYEIGPTIVSFSVPAIESVGSGWFQVESNPGSEALQQEPNDSLATATPIQWPGAINGRFDSAGDRDFFKFAAKKGQRLHFVAKTRELSLPCDVYMTFHKADGTQIAVARQEVESVLDGEVPEDGEYVLQVENLLVGEGAGQVYRIDGSDTYSGFTLAAEYPQYSSPQAGTFVVKVLAQRRGYDGPIDLHIEGLGDGVKLEGNQLTAAETLLKVTLPPSIVQGELRMATIVGTANVGGVTVSVPANQRSSLAGLFPYTPSLPTELERSIAVGVGPPFPPFFDLSIATNEVVFPQLVGASSFDVQITRGNEAFKEPLIVAVEGLPEEIKATVAPVDDGLKAVRVSLQGPTDLGEREIPIRVIGTGRFQEQTRQVTLADIKVRVGKPLAVSLTMAGPIAAGGTQQADVQLQRFGDDRQPVRLHVSDGPAGVSAPIFVTVPAEQNQVKIPFTADAAAPAGRYENLVVVAATTVKGQNVTVQSKPAPVEITKATP